jgi:uncharacterized protein YxeA
MKSTLFFILTIFAVLILCSAFFSIKASAGQAGVGVINVPPKYGYIRVEQQDELIRVYLNISDYNSWGDVYEVSVTLDNYGTEISKFIFKQYKSADSYFEVNEFNETPPDKNLLVKEKCFYEKSDKTETVNERCDIAVRFVFQKTYFTGISIAINDRAGSAPAEAYIYYNTEETMRSGNNIVIPWMGGTITIDTPAYILDLVAITIGLTGVIYYCKKRGMIERRRVVHEEA